LVVGIGLRLIFVGHARSKRNFCAVVNYLLLQIFCFCNFCAFSDTSGMSNSLIPGMGGHGEVALRRRIENLERFIGQFKTSDIVSKERLLGDYRNLEVLCIDRGLGEEPKFPPFDVKVRRRESKYLATVSPGVVCERITTDANAVEQHIPEGIFEDDGITLKEHEVSSGKSIAVKVEVLKTGAIGAESESIEAVEIVVVDTGKKSSHYIPHPVGSQADGAVGTMIYELAAFVEDGKKLVMKPTKHEGSHIDHFVDLPMFLKEAGEHDIFHHYDQPTGIYKTKGLSQDAIDSFASILIRDAGGELKFRTNGGNLDLTIKHLKLETPEGTDEISTTIDIPERTVDVSITLPDMTGSTDSGDGGHSHADNFESEGPYLVGSGTWEPTLGGLTTEAGDPAHAHSLNNGFGASTGITGLDHVHNVEVSFSGGAHDHGVTIPGATYSEDVSITIPAETGISVTLQIPKQPQLVAGTEEDFVLSWRQGLYAGQFSIGGAPAVTVGELLEKTICVLEEPVIP
jgi:hypothetical protein